MRDHNVSFYVTLQAQLVDLVGADLINVSKVIT
jgi:hypothetical protein